jgi:hypothetical protein
MGIGDHARSGTREPGPITHGTRVARSGTVSFVRSGFARVRWDDGRESDEWAADLFVEESR